MADAEPIVASFTDAGPFHKLEGALAAILTLRHRAAASAIGARRSLVTRADIMEALSQAGQETHDPELVAFLDHVRGEGEELMVLLTWGDRPSET